MEYRITLSHVDRAIDRAETVIVGRHPSETPAHVTLRVLAWCLLNEERIAFGPGLSAPGASDLWTRDLTGRLETWIECGTASADELRKVIQHNRGVSAHVVFGDEDRRQEFLDEVARWGEKMPKGWENVLLWTISPTLVAALAAHDDRRQRWVVTIVGDHMYVEADGLALDGDIRRG